MYLLGWCGEWETDYQNAGEDIKQLKFYPLIVGTPNSKTTLVNCWAIFYKVRDAFAYDLITYLVGDKRMLLK